MTDGATIAIISAMCFNLLVVVLIAIDRHKIYKEIRSINKK